MVRALLLTTAAAAIGFAQNNPMAADTKALYEITRDYILRSAEKIPDDLYSFRPVPEVRSVAELFGHIAEDQYVFCSPVKGEPSPAVKIEKVKTSKSDLTAALKEAFAYCDTAYAKATDESLSAMVDFFGKKRTKSGVLNFNSIHNYEHYGNLTTYMRIKGIVPPSSEKK